MWHLLRHLKIFSHHVTMCHHLSLCHHIIMKSFMTSLIPFCNLWLSFKTDISHQQYKSIVWNHPLLSCHILLQMVAILGILRGPENLWHRHISILVWDMALKFCNYVSRLDTNWMQQFWCQTEVFPLKYDHFSIFDGYFTLCCHQNEKC